MTIYSLDILLFLFGTSLLLVSCSNCCFITCLPISQEADFGIVNKAEIDNFLELSCFFDQADIVNLISGSSTFSKNSLNIWKFIIHVFLKPGLENIKHYFTSLWDECICAVIWSLFGIAFLWGRNENWPFPVLWPTLSFHICWQWSWNFLFPWF